MDPTSATVPLWADRVGPLVQALVSSGHSDRQCRRAELWQLLHAVLFGALRAQAGRIAPVTQEDLEDLASGKALELLQQAEECRWETRGHAPTEMVGFVWRVARNALVDLARRRGREAPPPTDADAWDRALADRAAKEAGPVDLAVAGEFVADLATCLEALAPRARAAWFRRVVLERPTRETAAALSLKSPHVDVLVARARKSLARCMGAKGHASTDVHPQAFVLMWSRETHAWWFDPPAGIATPRHRLSLADAAPGDATHA
jgi:RNA polymerase sigma factor (sigma-70 family)